MFSRVTVGMRRVAIALVGTLLIAACSGTDETTGPSGRPAQLAFLLLTPPGNVISTISVEVTGPGIDSPLVFNLTISGSVATGALRVPAGAGRMVVARAFDVSGVTTHRGDTTVTLVEGANPSVNVTMRPLVGTVLLTLSFGSTVVTINRQDTTLTSGDTIRYAAAALDWRGVVVPADSIRWASSNPGVATVTAAGLVTALASGTASMVATYEGAVVRRIVTVSGVLTPITGRIVFVSDRDGNEEIYVMNADGSAQQRLTNNGGWDRNPSLSPDGSLIAFERQSGPGTLVFLMNQDGSNVHRLTSTAGGSEYSPSWSPDGSRVVFTSEQGSYLPSQSQVFVVNVDGTGLTMLTNTARSFAGSYSPDGLRIAFETNRDGNHEVYVMNADGTGQSRLTVGGADNVRPRWSPDGLKIVFASFRDGNNEIYSMNADGTGVQRLTNSPGDDHAPAWSPDGLRIVFHSMRSGNVEIWRMNADGTVPVRVTTSSSNSASPMWIE